MQLRPARVISNSAGLVLVYPGQRISLFFPHLQIRIEVAVAAKVSRMIDGMDSMTYFPDGEILNQSAAANGRLVTTDPSDDKNEFPF